MKNGDKNKQNERLNKKLSKSDEQRLLRKQQKERSQELKSLKIGDKTEVAEALELNLRDKVVSQGSQFEDAGKKTAGIAQGKVVKRKGEDQRYMHKPSPKKIGNNIMNSNQGTFFWDNIRELMAGEMFSLLLYNRAPSIGLVDVDSDYFAITSRYLKDAQTFDAYKSNNKDHVSGLEKMIAACFYMGDTDFHGENLMVHQDESGQYVFDKIDHGRSLAYVNNSTKGLFDSTIRTLSSMYNNELSSKQVTFDYSVFKDELQSMRTKLSEERIGNIIDLKVAQLKRIGVEFNEFHDSEISNLKLSIATHINRIDTIIAILEIASDNLSSLPMPVSLDTIKEENINLLQNAVQTAIHNNTSINGMDPIKFAIFANIEIDNMPAIEYAITNNINVDGIDPISFCILHRFEHPATAKKSTSLIKAVEQAVKSGTDIYGMDPIKFAIIGNIEIDSKPALEYAIKKHKMIDSLDPIAFAALNDIKIQGKHPIAWAAENHKKIDGQNPILWAHHNNEKINNLDPIAWAINNNHTIRKMDAWKYAYTHSLQIAGNDPLKWAASNNHQVYGSDPVLFAFNNGIQLGGIDSIKWAITQFKTINNMNPTIAAANLGIQIDGEHPLDWVLANDPRGAYIKSAWNYANQHNELMQGVAPGIWFLANHAEIQHKKGTAFNDITAEIVKNGTLLPKGFAKHNSHQNKLEVLSHLLDLYSKIDPAASPDLVAIIKQDYNMIIDNINKDKSVVTLASSGFDKASSEKIAHKLEKMIQKNDITDITINSADLLQKCDFDMAVKITEIGKALENGPAPRSSNPFKQCADQLCKTFNKMVTSKHNKLTKDNINSALNIIATDRAEDVSVENKGMRSFTEQVSSSRSKDTPNNSKGI